MSGQYLEAHAFLKTLRDKGVPYTETLLNLMQYAVIEEVAPVVHAYWKLNANKNHNVCANCGTFATMLFDDDGERIEWLSDYCPNCGARMDGVEE